MVSVHWIMGSCPRPGQTKDYKICICCFSADHTVLRSKSKDWLAWIRLMCPECSDMSTMVVLFQWASTVEIQLSQVVLYKTDIIISSILFSPWYGWKIAHVVLNNNHSFHSCQINQILWHFVISSFILYALKQTQQT